jgi:hypothetical protein
MSHTGKIMKKFASTTIALIGFHAFMRNNVGRLPDQIILTLHPNIFYKTFIPLLMLSSAIVSFIYSEKINYFYLSVCTMLIDAINRLAVTINYYHEYFTYDYSPPPVPSPESIVIKINLVPSHIMLLIEIVTIILLFRYSAININMKKRRGS